MSSIIYRLTGVRGYSVDSEGLLSARPGGTGFRLEKFVPPSPLVLEGRFIEITPLCGRLDDLAIQFVELEKGADLSELTTIPAPAFCITKYNAATLSLPATPDEILSFYEAYIKSKEDAKK